PRKHPIYLGHVGKMTRRIIIDTAVSWDVTPWKKTVDASTLSFSSELKQLSPKRMECTQTLEVRGWTLPAAEAEQYRNIVTELELSDLQLDRVVKRNGKFARTRKQHAAMTYWTWLGIGLLLLGLAAAYVILKQRLS
ncbi:MAG: hypothetical protein ABUL55_02560, partial [Pseudomonadota bacterium]